MQERLKLAAFGGGLVVLFGAALGIGALVGEPESAPEHDMATHETHTAPSDETGLADSRSGYTLTDLTAPTAPNQAGPLRFRILGPDGAAVTAFTPQHEKKLHLIVARTDTTGYRHVHPVMDDAGAWSIDWNWSAPGSYRVFADFAPETKSGPLPLTLSRTVTVAGPVDLQPLPPPVRTANVDGYQVRMAGDLSTAGSELRFTVTKDGAPVTDLDPYLGAYGHLVALRGSDLAYLHVHPEGEIGRTPPGPEIAFHAQAPSTGQYRLFLDFSHRGKVRTAEFTAEVTGAPAAAGAHGHGH
ncbi:hypothetical protein D5S18_08400 [Nocardia panacis]|uniref:Heavy-metal-associated domain-containing protein n=1 Tax=Nocardia panacis TaxID=2340916 RepID=A0A3A4KP20_9NOCA|nr:hypothetical protein [Nocardia panacis]RJO76352.1 hypothetical protein D5S18_08400 [Nocardia panacis]